MTNVRLEIETFEGELSVYFIQTEHSGYGSKSKEYTLKTLYDEKAIKFLENIKDKLIVYDGNNNFYSMFELFDKDNIKLK